MALTDAGARAADVATTLAITVNDDAAGFIARESATEVEHLEAFAVAIACAAAGVAFAAVLGVANVVGARAREQWQANHHRAAARAASVVLQWLRDGAPRLTPS
jgi:nucleoside phosphorylase